MVTVGGRAAQLLFALAGNVLSARTLGPADFGRFGLIMGTVTITGTLADAGLTFAAIRFIARDRDSDTAGALATARTYLLLRIASGLLVSLLGVLLSAPIASAVLGQASLTPYLQLGFLILIGLSLSSYPGAVLTGLARFDLIGIAGVLNAMITAGGIVVLFASGLLNLGTLVLWNVALPIASTLPIWFLLPRDWLPWKLARATGSGANTQAAIARRLLRFGRWTAASNLGATLAAQVDLILLGRLTTTATVGIYSVAVTLASRLDILNQSLFTIMMPRVSRLKSTGEMRDYLRRLSRALVILAAALVAVALLAQPLILLLYGERYAEASPIFLVLLVVLVSDLFTTSLSLVAFPLDKPYILAAIEWIRVIVIAALGWPLIIAFGALGAALSRVASRAVSAIYIVASLRQALARSGMGDSIVAEKRSDA
jgi:O-antigen/teichoic acid export membrane protein